jgi:hypothetical protein
MIALGHLIPQYAGVLFMIGMSGQGAARGCYGLPYILAFDAINGMENRF